MVDMYVKLVQEGKRIINPVLGSTIAVVPEKYRIEVQTMIDVNV